MTTVRARLDSSASRLRVFREEELSVDDDLAEESVTAAAAAAAAPQPRVRQAKVTEPLPLPRPPRR